MFGQKTIPDPHQEIVDQYLREHNPCEPSKPLRINLRKYLQYAEEHHITDPSTIPDEILDQFMVEPQRAAQQQENAGRSGLAGALISAYRVNIAGQALSGSLRQPELIKVIQY